MFVRIYADGLSGNNVSRGKLAEMIADQFGVSAKPFASVSTDVFDLDIRENKEYIPCSDDFLYWHYYIEIDPADNDIGLREYVTDIKRIIKLLESSSFKITASCDFEELLT